jgi:hypothetical protein
MGDQRRANDWRYVVWDVNHGIGAETGRFTVFALEGVADEACEGSDYYAEDEAGKVGDALHERGEPPTGRFWEVREGEVRQLAIAIASHRWPSLARFL